MVEHSAPTLDLVFQALADPSRRLILRTLAAGEASISDLARPLRMSLAAASKHIQTLVRAGLISRAKRGRTHYCRLQPAALSEAHAWLNYYERYWTERLDALEAQLRADQTADSSVDRGAGGDPTEPAYPERTES